MSSLEMKVTDQSRSESNPNELPIVRLVSSDGPSEPIPFPRKESVFMDKMNDLLNEAYDRQFNQ